MPSWETPISASREIVEAISDAADTAVDAASSAVRSVRRRRSTRRALRVSWRWIAAALVVVAAAALVRHRRSGARGQHRVDPAGVGRSEAARTDGRIQEYGDDLLADASAARVGSAVD